VVGGRPRKPSVVFSTPRGVAREVLEPQDEELLARIFSEPALELLRVPAAREVAEMLVRLAALERASARCAWASPSRCGSAAMASSKPSFSRRLPRSCQ